MPPASSDVREFTLIKRQGGLIGLDLAALWRRRDLLWAFVQRDVKVHYQQTLLGPLWLLMQPLVTTLILAAMISQVIALPTGNAPAALFYLAAMIMWSYFSETVMTVSHVFVYHEYLFSKVAFPRIFVPVSVLLSNLIGVALQLGMLALLVAGMALIGWYDTDLGKIWILPLTFLFLMPFTLGVGLLIASTTAKFRDVANAVPFALQSAFLITPILYPYSAVPPPWRMAFAAINPLSVISDLWRSALTGSPVSASCDEMLVGAAVSLAVLIIGAYAFQQSQRSAVDTI